MKKSFVLVVALALAMVGALYSLPQSVVSDEKRRNAAATSGVTVTDEPEGQSAKAAPKADKTSHVEVLSGEDQQRLDALRAKFDRTSGLEKVGFAEQLSDLLVTLSRYDSAAVYAERAAVLEPGLPRWLKAGDRYYQAFTFAIDEQKGSKLGEKTREFYGKVLAENPDLLTAKTNLAMTYMATPTPMQGISLLREVLEIDPDNEGALFNLGLLSMRSNQYAKAAERFERILRSHPQNARAQFYLGISYAELGRKEEAKRWLLSVKKLEKDPTVQAGVDEYLKKLE
ncbi:MAG: tetratricopeptide repeat protein [Sphingobacteriaceae bacterium]|nr:tetratricopeptide repeat protein [Cytophagaceae bacterium]